MQRPYLGLTVILISILGISRIGMFLVKDRKMVELVSPWAKFLNAEGVLAMGAKLPFSSVGVYELELIRGVSDTLAFRLAAERKEILKRASALEPDEAFKSLEIVKGIGPKTALKLKQHLTLESQAELPALYQ